MKDKDLEILYNYIKDVRYMWLGTGFILGCMFMSVIMLMATMLYMR